MSVTRTGKRQIDLTTVDLVFKGGRICTSLDLFEAGIAVDQGRIVAVAKEPHLPNASRVINVEGKIIIPGLIDTHSHLREPGYTYKEDYETGTKAAAAGGVTTTIDMPNTKPPTNTVERFEEKKKLAQAKAVVDFGHLGGATQLQEIGPLVKAGAFGFKIFMQERVDYPKDALAIIDDGHLYQAFEEIAKTGVIAGIFGRNQEINDMLVKRYKEAGKTDPISYYEVAHYGNNIISTTAITKSILVQRSTGARLHVHHCNMGEEVEIVREAKKKGYNITAEANPKTFLMTRKEVEHHGPYALGGALRDQDVEPVWKGLNDGTIDVLGSDHSPHSREEKERGWKDMWSSIGGSPQLQEYLSLMLTEVNRGRIPLHKIVALTSENVAHIYRLYPKKGTVQPGADADLAVIDLKRKTVLKPGYSKCGWSVYDGREVQGVPVMTFVRGTQVMNEGEILVKPGFGQFHTPMFDSYFETKKP
ncbi:MAG: amidohydrolase family protein [Thaumarchaeota archaeon]|nr:amidohydrolase family protein [Nitrososphaerota archaeon]